MFFWGGRWQYGTGGDEWLGPSGIFRTKNKANGIAARLESHFRKIEHAESREETKIIFCHGAFLNGLHRSIYREMRGVDGGDVGGIAWPGKFWQKEGQIGSARGN